MSICETIIHHPPVFDANMALTFLEWWLDGLAENQWINLRMIRDKEPRSAQNFFFRTPAELVKVAAKAKAPWGTFFGVCPRKCEDGSKEAIEWLPGYWCDIDCGDEEESRRAVEPKIKLLPIQPDMIVGTPGGFHLWFRFKEMAEILPFGNDIRFHEDTMRDIAKIVGGDQACVDLSRVMRLPGSIHYKAEPRGVIAL